jgi:hypothetical protein
MPEALQDSNGVNVNNPPFWGFRSIMAAILKINH